MSLTSKLLVSRFHEAGNVWPSSQDKYHFCENLLTLSLLQLNPVLLDNLVISEFRFTSLYLISWKNGKATQYFNRSLP